ncbi:hypothetical protein ACF0H5_009590 [Mactra antiquata]
MLVNEERRYFRLEYSALRLVFFKKFHFLPSIRFNSYVPTSISKQEDTNRKKLFTQFSRKQIIGGCVLVGTVIGSVIFVTYEALTLQGRLQITNNVHETDRCTGIKFIYPHKKPLMKLDDQVQKNVNEKLTENVEKFAKRFIPWAQSKSKDPELLLRLVESEDDDSRRYGLTALTLDNEWEDYQYRIVSQGCSNKTLVSLARLPSCNDNFFRQLPWLPVTTEPLETSLQKLLTDLHYEVKDPGIKHYTGRVLSVGQPGKIIETEQWNLGDDPRLFEKLSTDDKNNNELIYLLQALVSHTLIGSQCIKILDNGGLILLHRIYIQYKDNIVICRLLAWIIANLSVHCNLHKSIIDGGWVTILHEWMKSIDTGLLFYTIRALANLDQDLHSGYDIQAVYHDGIYLTHPIHKTLTRRKRAKADIVFIHGLMGGPFKTWRQRDRNLTQINNDQDDYTYFWPKDWLGKDVSNIRILNVGYQTELTTWDTKHPVEPKKRTILSRSIELLDKLREADIGGRPVIFVGHSMGGLLIKEMLNIAAFDTRYSSMIENTIGVMFYSVPHHGSTLAKISNQAKYMIFPSVEVQELNTDNRSLKELHSTFLDLHQKYEFPVLSFGETEKTSIGLNMKTVFVPPSSSDPGCGEFVTVPTDHIGICKPEDKQSYLYKQSLFFIRKCLFHHTIKHTVSMAKQKLDSSLDK